MGIETEEKLPQTLEIEDDDAEMVKNEKETSPSTEAIEEQKLEQTLEIEEDDVDMKNDEEEEDISDDEDDDLRKEMEENFAKSEEADREKNKGMLDIINMIKNKAANKENEKKIISPKLKKIGIDVPILKPMAFDGNLNISFSSKQSENDKAAKMQKLRFH